MVSILAFYSYNVYNCKLTKFNLGGQWLHLRQPFCGPGFESKVHHQCFFNLNEKRMKINEKEVGIGPYFRKNENKHYKSFIGNSFARNCRLANFPKSIPPLGNEILLQKLWKSSLFLFYWKLCSDVHFQICGLCFCTNTW